MKRIGIFLYLVILLTIDADTSRRMKDLRDDDAGSKQFGFWVSAFSSRATCESAWLLIGVVGRVVLLEPGHCLAEKLAEKLTESGESVLSLLVAASVPDCASGW